MENFLIFSIVSIAGIHSQKNPHFIDDRNTIVHLFEWKWKDIARECEEFLGPNNYAGVQTSPPTENVIIEGRPWWERYQPVSYIFNTRSGNENDFADMVRRCNNVGIRIYPDVVFNHMAASNGKGTSGSISNASDESYPNVPYEKRNFHPSCTVDNYNNADNVRNCRLVGLPDLDQSQRYVQEKIIEFLNRLIDLGVAGFRIDAAKHMKPSDLTTIFNSLKNLNTNHRFPPNSKPYIYQEVIDIGHDAINNTEYTNLGTVVEFKHGKELGRCFQGKNNLAYLRNWGTEWGLIEGHDALVMIDNHDTQRSTDEDILTYKKSKQYKAATAFMFAHPYASTCRIMSSFAFQNTDQGPPNNNEKITSPGFNRDQTCTNGWICEHRWRQMYNMVDFRRVVSGTDLTDWWSDGFNQISFGRGSKGFIAISIAGNINRKLPSSLLSGKYCDVISGGLSDGKCTGKTVDVDGDGFVTIRLREDEEDAVVAIHVKAKL